MFNADGQDGLVRFWNFFRARERLSAGETTPAQFARLLRDEVSESLGRAVETWR